MAVPTTSRESYIPLSTRLSHSLGDISEWLNDEKMSRCHILKWISNHVDRPPSVLAKASIGFLLSVIFLNPSDYSGLITNALGLIPTAYHSVRHIQHSENPSTTPGLKKKENLIRREKSRRWLDYWLIYGTTCMIENVLGEDLLLGMLPFWWIFKSIWIIWFLVGLLDNEREHEVRPEPLRLRPRSILATKDRPSAVSTNSSSLSESPFPTSDEDDEEDDEDEDGEDQDSHDGSDDDDRSAISTSSSEGSPSKSAKPLSPKKLEAIRSALNDLDSPMLSVTPALRPKRAVTPITGISSDGDISIEDEKSDSDAESEGEDGDDGDFQESDSDKIDFSDEDDDDDVLLPPDTPKDELALRGKKTKAMPTSASKVPDSDSDSDGETEEVVQPKLSDKIVEEFDAEKKLVDDKSKETSGENIDQPKLRTQDRPPKNDALISSVKSETNDKIKPIERTGSAQEEKVNKEEEDQQVPEKQSEKPKSSPAANPANKVIDSPEKKNKGGEVVKLSIEDLLAMDQEDTKEKAGKDKDDKADEGKSGDVPPLLIKKKSKEGSEVENK